MDNVRDPAKGLSVWLWGPTLWSVLHCLAFLCDTRTSQLFEPASIDGFFTYLQPLLPCEFCRDSYGGFLVDVCKARGETVGQAFERRHLVAFVVDLHDKVNTKLAKQRWNQVVGLLRSKLSNGACKELFACEGLEEEVANVIDKRPTLTVVRNRGELFKRDLVNVEGVLLLLLVFGHRLLPSQVWNFTLVLAVMSMFLQALPPQDAQDAGAQLQELSKTLKEDAKQGAFDKPRLVDALLGVLFSYSKPSVSAAEFRVQTESRLVLMLAKSCGQGTCR